MLSRTVEDTGTVTSPLIPWNSCGAYMTGVLGVPTVSYFPFAFFNLINPVIAIAFGFLGYRVEHTTDAQPDNEPTPLRPERTPIDVDRGPAQPSIESSGPPPGGPRASSEGAETT